MYLERGDVQSRSPRIVDIKEKVWLMPLENPLPLAVGVGEGEGPVGPWRRRRLQDT